jgi:hypothetical protein
MVSSASARWQQTFLFATRWEPVRYPTDFRETAGYPRDDRFLSWPELVILAVTFRNRSSASA